MASSSNKRPRNDIPYEQKKRKLVSSAQTLENDFNYAFHLQMQESMKSSLASTPLKSPASSSLYPYGKGLSSSSSSNSSSSEVFKVYVKGLVSEERVKDATVSVAAIGVVICDSKDHQIFELRKPLVNYRGRKAALSSSEVGFEALVKGLNAAIDLNLKRVTCFCDEYTVHRYVMGGHQPPHNIYKLLHDVMLLKTKFVQFSLVLVARKDMKSAFKLAREAILSQITWPSKNDPKMILMETCIICFEDTVSGKMFSLDSCLHRFCLSCMKQHAEAKLLCGTPVKCPREGCKTELNIEKCGKFLNPETIDIMRQREKEASIPVTEKVYCPYPKCSFLMSKKEVLEYTKTIYNGGSPPGGARKCIKCQLYFCIYCKAPWHYKMDCKDFITSNAYHSAGDAKLKSLASKKLWRPCGKCSNMVELSSGCYHINCRCGHEFCYRCGAAYKDKKATCKCPLWDEPAMIIYNNDLRRRG